jgi:hypothetical protein
MKFDTAWLFYRSNRAMALAADVSDQAVSQWKAKGFVPFDSALVLESHSHGKIKMNPKVYVAAKKKARSA